MKFTGSMVALGLGVLLGWVSWSYVQERDRAIAARRQFVKVSGGLESARKESAGLQTELGQAQHELGRLNAERKKRRQRLDRARYELAELRDRVEALTDVGISLTPPHTRVDAAQLLPARGDITSHLVILWSKGPEDLSKSSGLLVWRAGEGFLSVRPRGTSPDWELAFTISIRYSQGVTTVGRPGAERTEGGSFGRHAPLPVVDMGPFQTGDLTGDGYPDVLSFEDTHGSGGCGIWRVLSIERGQVTQLLRRYTCETYMRISSSSLRVDSAIYPRGCASTHGCGSRRSFLRWDGSTWHRISTRVTDRF